MVAGNVDHEAGTRDVTKLGGLMAAMPITFGAALLAALSMGGLPPFVGFLAKEEIYYGTALGDPWSIFITTVAIAGNALMFVIGFAVALKPFLGEKVETPKAAHEAPLLMYAGPAVLAIMGLIAALFSGLFHQYFSSPMASAVAGVPLEITISVIPHLGIALTLSLVTIALGIVAYLKIAQMRDALAKTLETIGWGPDLGFDQAMSGLVRGATRLTRTLQSGSMEIYVATVFVALAISLVTGLIRADELPQIPAMPDLFIYEWAIIIICVIGLFSVLFAKNRLTAIVSLGIQGFAVAILFMLMGAPDLSFTQFMVETLSVVILALVMTRLRLSPQDHRSIGQTVMDASIAFVCAAAMTLILLGVLQTEFDPTLTEFFNAYSYTIAQGKNIVNVILVDFRGVDTFGEIAVVMVSGLAILALIRVLPKGKRASGSSPVQEADI